MTSGALVAALLAIPASAPAGLAPRLTAGYIEISYCEGDATECGDPSYAFFSLTGTFAVAGEVYVGELTGRAETETSFELGSGFRTIASPFTLRGHDGPVEPLRRLGEKVPGSPTGTTITLACDGLALTKEGLNLGVTNSDLISLAIRCSGNIDGATGSRKIAVRAREHPGEHPQACPSLLQCLDPFAGSTPYVAIEGVYFGSA